MKPDAQNEALTNKPSGHGECALRTRANAQRDDSPHPLPPPLAGGALHLSHRDARGSRGERLFEDFNDLASEAVPDGGFLVSLMRAYFDESGTHRGSPIMTVSGYVMRKPQVSRFNKQWGTELVEASKGQPKPAPYFHMKDARDPPTGVFEGWDPKVVDSLARKLIAQTRQRTLIGLSVIFTEANYNKVLAGYKGMPSAYAFGCYAVLGMIRRWADSKKIDQRFAYFFESGHDDENDADAFMCGMFRSARIKTEYRHFSHAFVGKEDAPPLQASDMLSWHAVKRFREPERDPRKDFVALIREDIDLYRYYEMPDLERLAEAISTLSYDDEPVMSKRRLTSWSGQSA